MAIADLLKEKWRFVDDNIEKVLNSPMLKLPTSEKDGLKEEIAALKEKRYTIAICGDAKVGKSTFLNALIFGDSILPTFDTPLTAKLTFIKYTDEPSYAEVEFLSSQEWTDFQEDVSGDEKLRDQFNKQLVKCDEMGIREDEWVGHGVLRLDDYTKIGDYVCDPTNIHKPGLYTPFVKSVTVFIHHPALRNLDIVDTPGLNDTNRLNSGVTEKWVHNAHAVVYLLTPEGVRDPDKQFFKVHFPSSAVEARVFVQNKIDSAPTEYERVKRSIAEYGRQPEYQKLKLFGPKEVICSYSGLWELIYKKHRNGLPLTEDEAWWMDRWENGADDERMPSGFKGDPDGLEKVLAQKLFDNEGQARLSKAIGKIREFYVRARAEVEAQIERLKLQTGDFDKDIGTLQKELDKFGEFRQDLTDLESGIRDKADDFVKARVIAIKKAFEDARTEILRKVHERALACDRSDTRIRDEIPGCLRESSRSEFGVLFEKIDKVRVDLRDEIRKYKDDIDLAASKVGIKEKVVTGRFSVDFEGAFDDMRKGMVVDGEELYDQVPWKIRQFFRGDTRESIAEKITGMVSDVVEGKIQSCLTLVESKFRQLFDNESSNLLRKVREYIDSRASDLESAKANVANKQEEKSRLLDEKKASEDLSQRLQTVIDEFDRESRC